jgi:NAD(P)-dependent dehydrogenase (short-subunit alcohol dehydrogenase family)
MALNPPLPAWPDCRVWIIGASTGIGAATARALLAAGARVAISARNAQLLTEVGDGRANAHTEPLDYTDSAQVAAAWRRIRAAWGDVDLVLIVAGTHAEIRAWELTEQNAMALLETNLHGVIKTTAVVLPALLAQGKGAIGIVSRVAGYRGLPKALVYGASKAALINLSRRGRVRDPLSEGVYPAAQIPAHPAVSLVLCSDPQGDRAVTDAKVLERVVAFFEHMAPGDVAHIGEIYASDAYFRDPFNEVRGVAAIARVYAHIFEQLDDCRFVITDTVAEGDDALLVWVFTFRVRRWRRREMQAIHGASHLKFTADGKVGYHRDYWDAAEEFYAKLPLIGTVLRFLRGKLA